MTASSTTVDRRPIPMVAIIGNDAVLAAAPATPVQLAHACLRRGFTVAVPASWGDELVAAEAVRRLSSRERGPAVMCVCPFARSRLLARGPDLEPFLVSLVSPPVATARYLRALYGEHGVHITYIGGCPGAEDISIDARLTPNAFLADLAEHGVALSEQPLVFDSIVPPDRRRWCSLPGGAPTAEILWADSDTRTLVEIDREDVSTDLAQHIITHEHVLLDLSPGLGCVCSGAIGSLPSRSARASVTALEPPRALRPIIDPTPLVSLDVPVGEQPAPVLPDGPSSRGPEYAVSREDRLDELLGVPGAELAVEIDVQIELHAPGLNPDGTPAAPTETEAPATLEATRQRAVAGAPTSADDPTAVSPPTGAPEATAPPAVEPPTSGSAPERIPEPSTPATPSPVRRRTPAPMPTRHPASTFPRATASDGRALPRAYVAKRRTPEAGVPLVVDASPSVGTATDPRPSHDDVPPPARAIGASPAVVVQSGVDPQMEGPVPDEPSQPAESAVAGAEHEKPAATAPEAREPARTSPSATPADAPVAPRGAEKQSRAESKPAGGAVTATDTNPTALVALLVALLALGFFVVRALH